MVLSWWVVKKTYIFKNGLLGTKVPISRVCLFVLVVVEDLTWILLGQKQKVSIIRKHAYLTWIAKTRVGRPRDSLMWIDDAWSVHIIRQFPVTRRQLKQILIQY